MLEPLLRTNCFETTYSPLDYSVQSARTCHYQAIEPQVGRPDYIQRSSSTFHSSQSILGSNYN